MLPGGERFTIDALAANVDVAPTLMALAGDTAAHGFQGRSLVPLLADPIAPFRARLLLEGGGRGWCGFRSSRWKYVQHGNGEEEIYDLLLDPYELANERPQRVVKAMRFRELVLRSRCRPPGLRPLRPCTITGTRRADRIGGTPRRDWICAGAGNDVIDVRRGGVDTVRCGRGRDTVYADARDRIATDCERIRLRARRS
jgi:hypothetical protein